MSKVTIDNVTDVVIASLGQNGDVNDRQREIMTALMRFLNDEWKDGALTHDGLIEAW